jgi:hypothetical protein
MITIFPALRLLSFFMSKPSTTPKNQAIFTRGLCVTEYKSLVMLDQNSRQLRLYSSFRSGMHRRMRGGIFF